MPARSFVGVEVLPGQHNMMPVVGLESNLGWTEPGAAATASGGRSRKRQRPPRVDRAGSVSDGKLYSNVAHASGRDGDPTPKPKTIATKNKERMTSRQGMRVVDPVKIGGRTIRHASRPAFTMPP